MSKNTITNYIFDFDGTLADTQTVIFQSWVLTCEQLSLPIISLSQIRSMMGWSLIKIAQTIAKSEDVDIVQNLILTYRKNYQIICNAESSPIKLFDGTVEMLQNLKDSGKTLFVVSAKPSQTLNLTLEQLEIKKFFVEIIGADDVIFTKPNPEAIETLISKYNLIKSETIIIGDALVDIQMGQNAKVKTCGVTWGATDPEIIATFGADWVADSVAEIGNNS